MKKILLLGGYGFIGTNILKYIDTHLQDKYSVIVFDRTLNHPHGVTFECVEKSFEGDFSNKTILRSIFNKYKFDYIIHALNTTVPSTSINPRFDIESNLLPTIDLLDLLVEFDAPKIIFLSSGGAIYGDTTSGVPHKETDPVFPKSSYGIVKLAIEKYLFQYKELCGLHPLVLRISNPYGPYHYSLKQGIINVSLDYALTKRKLEVWGDGEAKKDYIYINDFCFVLFELIRNEIQDRIFNIASNEILSINHILGKIKFHFPEFSWIYTKIHKNDILHFQLDTSELTKCIGKVDMTPLDRGLVKTIKWLKS